MGFFLICTRINYPCESYSFKSHKNLLITKTVVYLIFRYQLYGEGNSKTDRKCIPLCQDILKHHFETCNLPVCHLGKISEASCSDTKFSWTELGKRNRWNKWISLMPGPEEILKLLSCDCHKVSNIVECICIVINLNCTDICHLIACDNNQRVEEEHYFNDEDQVE